jgi:hypothetical protein
MSNMDGMINLPVSSKAEIGRLLKGHYGFGECVLEDVRWKHQGTTLDLVFNYIWLDSTDTLTDSGQVSSGEIRADLGRPELRILRFHIVQEYHVHNDLNDLACENVYELGEGFSEVAAVRLEDDPVYIAKYQSLARPFHHVTCWWEAGRRIDVVFSELQVISTE